MFSLAAGRNNTSNAYGSIVLGSPAGATTNGNGGHANTFVFGDQYGMNLSTYAGTSNANSAYFSCAGNNGVGRSFVILTNPAKTVGVVLAASGTSWAGLSDINDKRTYKRSRCT